ncbi:glycosyl hydrolase 9C2 [Perilla frutescens var. hirtella]|nr:glycosyl hydrolase 9C2 [Perilla frutescens var. hirtella]
MDEKSLPMAALLVVVFWVGRATAAGHDYGEALTKSILFFEAQRSGYLPSNQRVQWRGNSGLTDGKINGVDLVGGYYDAGDNVKFGLPMAFTITMMSWGIIEYGGQIDESGQLQHALDAVKWGTDYFIKAHPQPYVLYGEVGDGNTDHYCWQRPEDMTTSRAAYKIDADHPGSDLAGETAAAMASASIVFRRYNSSYSAELLKHAHQLFDFADKYRGKYDSSITVAQKYYRSVSGYADELLWAAAWLYKATNNEYYLNYLGKNGDSLGGTGWAITEFGWDVKYAGVQTLVAQFLLAGKGGKHTPIFKKYQEKAEYFMCSCNAQKTPGGLIFRQRWNNMQFVTSASFLMTVYSDYLTSSAKSLTCANGVVVSPPELLALAKSQVDYILGDNPRATSYMVGYGKNYPQQVHHRASSIVSYKVDPSFVSCRGGYAAWFNRKASDPNILTGAVVGGPDAYDNFADHRDNYEQTEPATYNTAPLVGILARLHAGHTAHNQLLSVELPSKPIANVKPATNYQGQASLSMISVDQKVTTSWIDEGRTFYRYSAIVTNKYSKNLKSLKLRILNLYGPLWGLNRAGDYYFFPDWIDSLAAGKSIEFVYIHSASQAEVSVLSYTLV